MCNVVEVRREYIDWHHTRNRMYEIGFDKIDSSGKWSALCIL